jgi:hypothetical protein
MVSSVDGLAGAAAVGRQVPPQRREVASETPDEQESQPPDIALAYVQKSRLNKGGCKCPKATG